MPTHIARARDPEQTSGGPVIDRSAEAIARHRVSPEGQAGMRAFLDKGKAPWIS